MSPKPPAPVPFARKKIDKNEYLEISIHQRGLCSCCQEQAIPTYKPGMEAMISGDDMWLICVRCDALLGEISKEPKVYQKALRFHRQNLTPKTPSVSAEEVMGKGLPEDLGF